MFLSKSAINAFRLKFPAVPPPLDGSAVVAGGVSLDEDGTADAAEDFVAVPFSGLAYMSSAA